MPGNVPTYYWDSCIFLAWLKDEERKAGEMDGVREVIERSKRREVHLMTSVITTTEVLAAKIPAGMDTLFKGMMKRLTQVSVDIRVANLAHDVRDFYAKAGQKTVSVPDAIHLATGILYRVAEFHTFDGDSSRNSLGLLPLSGDVAGNKMIICKPESKRPQLDLRKPKP